jgi:hypothetical protein
MCDVVVTSPGGGLIRNILPKTLFLVLSNAISQHIACPLHGHERLGRAYVIPEVGGRAGSL